MITKKNTLELEMPPATRIIAIGSTRSGKSTFLNFLLDPGRYGKKHRANGDLFKPTEVFKTSNTGYSVTRECCIKNPQIEVKKRQKNDCFPQAVGDSPRAPTKIPTFLTCVDTPGANDSKGPIQDLENAIHITE